MSVILSEGIANRIACDCRNEKHSNNIDGMIMKKPEWCSDDDDDSGKIRRSEIERQRI
jgi:hypothetical protein